MKNLVAFVLCASMVPSSATAQMGRRGGGARPAMQNRSAGGNYNRGGNVNNNANVNRNVNVNNNVNVNRNVNVNTNVHGGGCYNCYYHDNSWNGGSFAAGVAVGAVTTAVVAAATRPSTTVVVSAPAVGTVLTTLPGGCGTVSTSSGVIYGCNNVYYRPYYQGAALVYQVVTYP
jgi:hypothetical protein